MTDRTSELGDEYARITLGGRVIEAHNLFEVIGSLETAIIILDGAIGGLREQLWEVEERIKALESQQGTL